MKLKGVLKKLLKPPVITSLGLLIFALSMVVSFVPGWLVVVAKWHIIVGSGWQLLRWIGLKV